MRKIFLVSILIIVVSAAISVYYLQFAASGQERGIETTVSRVVDGDTLELANGDVVRLIGIDAPEKTQVYHDDVVERLKKLEGKIVRMEKDKTNKDRYGRYLRYVFLDDKFVNLELLRGGLAYLYVVSPDNKYQKEFSEAEAAARAEGLGIWGRSEYADCIELESFHYNAKGEDDKNLLDEFFVVKNSCEEKLDTGGWSVRNSYNTFKIPKFDFESGSEMKIISGAGKNGEKEVFIGSERPIWNNKGDTLYLRDGYGRMILSKSYKNE